MDTACVETQDPCLPAEGVGSAVPPGASLRQVRRAEDGSPVENRLVLGHVREHPPQSALDFTVTGPTAKNAGCSFFRLSLRLHG